MKLKQFNAKFNYSLLGWIVLITIITLSYILSIVVITKNNNNYNLSNIDSQSIKNQNTIMTDILKSNKLSTTPTSLQYGVNIDGK